MAKDRDWPHPLIAATGSEQAELPKILKPSKVDNGIPNWLKNKLDAYSATHGELELFSSDDQKILAVAKQEVDAKFLEHIGKTTIGNYCYFVSEPFHFTSEHAKRLDQFCEQLGGLEWSIYANSYQCPGTTIRILMRETDG